MKTHLPQPTIGRSFFTAMALLVVAVSGCGFGLWLLWTTVFEPQPSNLARAAEAGAFAVIVHDANSRVDSEGAFKDRLKSDSRAQNDRVQEAAHLEWVERSRDAWPRLGGQGMMKLVELQEADVLRWRLRRGFLFVLPALAIGMGTGWLGMRILRRLQVQGTIFASESESAPPGPVEPATKPTA